jgi:hypothetical protein
MKASVIVSDTLSQGQVVPCAHILCAQDFPSDAYEVILPDLGLFNSEEAHLLSGFEKQYPHFRVLRRPGLNRAELINAAAAEAKGDLLLFIESHCLASKSWVADHAAFFAREKSAATLGAFRTVPPKSTVGEAEESMRAKVFRRLQDLVLTDAYFDFHNAALTADAFRRLGGLEPRLPLMGEFDLGARLHREGVAIRQAPDILVWHINDSALASYSAVIGGQGRDRSRMIRLRGPDFVKTYFPQRRLLAALPLVRAFRWPLLALAGAAIAGYGAAFRAANALGLRSLAHGFFERFAAHSLRRGLLLGLGDRV